MSDKRKKRRHFSLIEMMVCVAILSIAASVTIPRYMRHVFAERQSECEEQLRAIHAAEQLYFRDNSRYTADLRELEWTPPPTPLYLYGFRQGSAQTVHSSLNPTTLCPDTERECYTTERMVQADHTPLALKDLPSTAVAADGFVAACVGNLDSDAELDRMTINQNGQLLQITSDLD